MAVNEKNTLESQAKTNTIKIILLSVLVMALWGSLFPFVQWGFKEFALNTDFVPDLILFAGLRFLVSGFILSLFTIKNKEYKTLKKKNNILGILLVGLFAIIFHYSFTYIGLSKINSASTALLKQSGVLVFVCFSFLFIKEEKFSILKLLAAFLGIASIVVVNMDAFHIKFDLGSLLVIGASFCTVIYNVIYKKFLKDVPALAVTGYSQLFGGLILLVVGLCFGGRLRNISLTGMLIFVYLVLATIVSYWLWYSIVKKYDLSKLFIVKMSEPLFAALVSVALPLNSKITIEHLLAFILVSAAIVLSNIQIKHKEKNKNIEQAKEEKVYESNASR